MHYRAVIKEYRGISPVEKCVSIDRFVKILFDILSFDLYLVRHSNRYIKREQ